MGHSNFFNMPVDNPHVEKQGLKSREADEPGNASHLTLPPEDPVRKEKGDLSMKTIKDFEPKPLSHSGEPWKNLRGGR